MAGWGKIVLAAVTGLVLGVAGGGYAGLRLGVDTMATHWMETEARHSQEVIAILEDLRADRLGEARAGLESHLNRHVFGLMPSARENVNVSERALEKALTATQRVRAYRERYPHDGQTALDRDVRRYLAGQ